MFLRWTLILPDTSASAASPTRARKWLKDNHSRRFPL
jgi:hypothetical protein